MAYIRSHYLVPARRGGRVRVYDGREGRITGARGCYLMVRLDGERRSLSYHPTWKVTYL